MAEHNFISLDTSQLDMLNIQNLNRSIHETNDLNQNEILSELTNETISNKTWSETFYRLYIYGKITKDVYDLSKVVSPAETVRRIARYTINPAARLIDYYTGLENRKITFRGRECSIPSFAMLGTVVTEGVAFAINPAQWGAYQAINVIGQYVTEKVIKHSGIENNEAKAAITLGSSLFLQQAWGHLENTEKVKSVYKVVNAPLEGVNKKLDKLTKFTDEKIINKTLGKVGIDTETPLGLTAADIQREEKLIAAEENLTDTKEKLEQLTRQENDLKDQLATAEKKKLNLEIEKSNRDAIDIKSRIQQTREHEKHCPEKKSNAKYKKHKGFKKVFAKTHPEIFKKENNLSDQDAENFSKELLKGLKETHGEKQHNKVLEKVSKKYKALLQEQSLLKLRESDKEISEIKEQLDNISRAKTKTEKREIATCTKEYAKAAEEFKNNANPLQQNKFFAEQNQRQEQRQSPINTTGDNLPLSGNIQFEISADEIEKMINDYIKDNELYRMNMNDNINKVFLNLKGEEKIKIHQNSDNSFQIAIPIKIDNKRNVYNGVKGKVSKINLEVMFNLQLQESTPEKLLNASIAHPSFSMKNSVFFKVLALPPKINIENTAHEIVSEKFPEAMMKLKNTLEKALGKESVFNFINKYMPTGMDVNESTISIKVPKIKDGNATFDVDVDADFQYQISAEKLQNEFKPFVFNAEFLGLPLGGYSVDKIANINMSNDRIKADVSLSGPVAGTLTTSFKTQFLSDEQRFVVNDMQFDCLDTNSVMVQAVNVLPRALQNCIPLHDKIEDTFNNIFKNAPSSIISNLQKQVPGNLIVDKDSLNIMKILFDNNSMIIKGKLSSDTRATAPESLNQSSFFYSNCSDLDLLNNQ